MAGKSTQAGREPEETGGTALVVGATHQVPADLMSEMEGMDGAGTSSSADDSIVPFLALLQDNSPEVKKRDPKYVDGAEPGTLINKATRQIWLPDEDCIVIPCHFERTIVEWVPRSAGGGSRGRHPITEPTVEATLLKMGAVQREVPQDDGSKKLKWVNPENGNEYIDTRYQYVLIESDGMLMPAVMAFSSTGHQSARAWMALQRRPMPGTTRIPPAWFRRYNVRRTTRSNNQGSWFVLEMQDRGWVEDAQAREMGRALNVSVSSGAMTAAVDDDVDGAGAGTSSEKDDIPI